MSMEDAKTLLGFPPGASPSPSEVNKAYRQILKTDPTVHPDHGGSHERLVEINVAKEILEGKRREDRTPYKPTPKPAPVVDLKKQRQEEDERDRRDTLGRIADEAKKCMEALEPALRSSDFSQGRMHIPAFLNQDYLPVLSQMHDEIESTPKSPDMLKARAICHTLTGMAVRLASRAQKIVKDHGEAWASLIGMGGSLTYKDAVALHVEKAKFVEGWTELHAESGKLRTLINTSENVPATWDDLYNQSHGIIDSFKNDFKQFNGHSLEALERQLKLSVMSLEGMTFMWGYKIKTPWSTWKMPADFTKVADFIKVHKGRS